MSKRRQRYSIRNPKSFRKGASRNANKINKLDSKLIERKIREKKADILSFLEKLISSKIVEEFRVTRYTKRSLWVNCRVIRKKDFIELRFFFWTERNKPQDQTNANMANFFIKPDEGIKKKKRKVLQYLEGIQRGSTTEDLTSAALNTLKEHKKIHYFRPAKPSEDRDQGKDFIAGIWENGFKIEVPIQVKSSEKDLYEHQKKYPEIPGLYREFKGDIDNQIEIIKEKIIKIIESYKQNKIIFV